MADDIRPGMEKRVAMMKLITDYCIPLNAVNAKRMEGKSDEEKEQIAEEITRELEQQWCSSTKAMRYALWRECLKSQMPLHDITEILKFADGKSEEEKEQMAAMLIMRIALPISLPGTMIPDTLVGWCARFSIPAEKIQEIAEVVIHKPKDEKEKIAIEMLKSIIEGRTQR